MPLRTRGLSIVVISEPTWITCTQLSFVLKLKSVSEEGCLKERFGDACEWYP